MNNDMRQYNCYCGSTINIKNKSRHLKTSKHLEFIDNSIENFENDLYKIKYKYYFDDELIKINKIKEEKQKKELEQWNKIFTRKENKEIYHNYLNFEACSNYGKIKYIDNFERYNNKRTYYCGENELLRTQYN